MSRYCWVLPLSNKPKHNYVGPAVTERLRSLLTFCPVRVQSSFEISPSKAKLRSADSSTYCATSLHEVSCVTKVWYQAHPIPFHHLGRKSIRQLP